MHYRLIGKTDLVTSEVGFGCARIGGLFQGSSRHEIVALLRRAHMSGITFFDTADMYTQGESERLVGESFAQNRHDVLIASKFGYCLPRQKQFVGRVKPFVKPLMARLRLKPRQVHAGLRGVVSQQDFSSSHVVAAVHASLRRLRTDYIDIYQLHDPPQDVLERGEFVDILESLKQAGKIRQWGVAVQGAVHALASLQYPSLASVQISVSVLEQAALCAAIPEAAQHGTGVVARQVFASGLLTRPVDSLRLEDIDEDAEAAARKREILAGFSSVASESGRTGLQMALQFALAQEDVSVVLLGMSRASQLEANLTALRATPLTDCERTILYRLWKHESDETCTAHRSPQGSCRTTLAGLPST